MRIRCFFRNDAGIAKLFKVGIDVSHEKALKTPSSLYNVDLEERFSDKDYTFDCTEAEAAKWVMERARTCGSGEYQKYWYEVIRNEPRQLLIDFTCV